MENDIYFESIHISYQTINIFEEMYENKKKEIMNDLKKKHNININGRELSENTTITKTEYNHTTKG